MDTFLSILLFIVSLGILIVIHELGHLSMAKLFNVYCQEFSIGFGPALLKKRKKGKETYFCIRAIPLGGYVAMYGEDVELEDGVVIGEERSLEGIKKWKKAIIVAAGITLNALLALTLFAVSNICMPIQANTNISYVEKDSVAELAGFKNDDRLYCYGPTDTFSGNLLQYQYEVDKKIYAGSFFIVDDNVTIGENKYVLTYSPAGNKDRAKFSSSIKLYTACTTEEEITDVKSSILKRTIVVDGKQQEVSWKDVTLNYFPNFKKDAYAFNAEGDSYLTALTMYRYNEVTQQNEPVKLSLPIVADKDKKATEVGLSFNVVSYWLDFGTRVQNTFKDFGNASVAVFKGIGTLFTSGIKNMSGIVGIFNQSATLFSNYTFATYLYFWGLISVNLAIFNLLPFPGLDGWALLVTAVEGATRKKIPSKIKNIVSLVGLILLFTLMIAIVVLDIIRMAGGSI